MAVANTKTEYWRWTEYTWHSDKGWQGASTITAGIDIGSVSSQCVIMTDGEIYAIANLRTGSNSPDSARRALAGALKDTEMREEAIQFLVGTGYGRVNVPMAQRAVTEIACHGRGAFYMNNSVRTILDMGGQDCKAIQIDERGKVTQFLMNDKCAAGTGRGLEVMADLLAIPITEVGPMSLAPARQPKMVSSTCVIFAKSEAISLLREGWDKAEVLASYCEAMAHRAAVLIRRIGVKKEFTVTGGIAKNSGIVRRVERELGVEAVEMKPDPQIAGALGAALFARDFLLKARVGS